MTRIQTLRRELEQLGAVTSALSELHLKTSQARARLEELQANRSAAEDLQGVQRDLEACVEAAETFERRHRSELARADECGKEFTAETTRAREEQRSSLRRTIVEDVGMAYAKACDQLADATVELAAHSLALEQLLPAEQRPVFSATMVTHLKFNTPPNLPELLYLGKTRDLSARIAARAHEIVTGTQAAG